MDQAYEYWTCAMNFKRYGDIFFKNEKFFLRSKRNETDRYCDIKYWQKNVMDYL